MTTSTAYAKTSALVPTAWTICAQLPNGALDGCFNMRVVTRDNSVDTTVQVAIVPDTFAANLTAADVPDECHIQPKNLKIGPTGVKIGIYEDTGIVLTPGHIIVAKAGAALLSARVHGYVTGA